MGVTVKVAFTLLDYSTLIHQLAHQDLLEWTGLITGIIYIFLATYQRPEAWIFGIISSIAIAWKSFTDYKLMADGILQVFYVVMGGIGLWQWISGRVGNEEKPIMVASVLTHVIAVVVCIILAIPVSMLLMEYAGARFSFQDTLVTLLSIWATVLLIRKELYNWVYWIILDFFLVFLYFLSQAYLFSILFVIYTVIAIVGYIKWRKDFLKLKHGVGW